MLPSLHNLNAGTFPDVSDSNTSEEYDWCGTICYTHLKDQNDSWVVFIDEIYVFKGCRRRRVATSMLHNFANADAVWKKDSTSIDTAFLFVSNSNEAARNLYAGKFKDVKKEENRPLKQGNPMQPKSNQSLMSIKRDAMMTTYKASNTKFNYDIDTFGSLLRHRLTYKDKFKKMMNDFGWTQPRADVEYFFFWQ